MKGKKGLLKNQMKVECLNVKLTKKQMLRIQWTPLMPSLTIWGICVLRMSLTGREVMVNVIKIGQKCGIKRGFSWRHFYARVIYRSSFWSTANMMSPRLQY